MFKVQAHLHFFVSKTLLQATETGKAKIMAILWQKALNGFLFAMITRLDDFI